MPAAPVVYRDAVLVDTSAVIALMDANDQYHQQAQLYFGASAGVRWVALNITSHEAFTRSRYARGLGAALTSYDFLRSAPLTVVTFSADDEVAARELLARYHDQVLSFHDALCAVVMRRLGMYRVFTFDRDFWALGFSVEPGVTR